MAEREKKGKQIKEALYIAGYTVKSWARENNYPEQEVYKILSGERKGYYGRSNEIARALGLFNKGTPDFHADKNTA